MDQPSNLPGMPAYNLCTPLTGDLSWEETPEVSDDSSIYGWILWKAKTSQKVNEMINVPKSQPGSLPFSQEEEKLKGYQLNVNQEGQEISLSREGGNHLQPESNETENIKINPSSDKEQAKALTGSLRGIL